ncbi:hypothetical protein HDU97_004847 [Phlyctochytrium planicorne]|nr:hypothetical protein HDU97_004847 [Phlyctochytrium planicorne]
MPILVTGATGKVGAVVVRELLSKGASVRVFVRNKAKAEASFKGLNVEYAEGDNSDLKAFGSACAGVERLFLLTLAPVTEPEMAKAAVAAGVKQIVKLSCIFATASSMDYGGFMQMHGQAEVAIMEAVGKTASVTFLRPSDYMTNILSQGPAVKGQGQFYLNNGKAVISSISLDDIGASAAAVLIAPVDLYNGLGFTLTGPEAIDGDALAAEISVVAGKKVSYVPVDEAAYVAAMAGYGLPVKFCIVLAQLGPAYRLMVPPGSNYVTGWVKYLTGKEPKSWKQFLAENKAVFA